MVAVEDWSVDGLERAGAKCGALRRAAPRAARGRARHAVRALSLRRVRRPQAPRHLGPAGRHAAHAGGRPFRRHRQRRHHPRPRPLSRLRAPGRPAVRGGWASWTRRWSSRAARARRSSSAPAPGASRRSPTTACSCRRRRASRGRCPSGMAIAAGRSVELGRAIGELTRSLRAGVGSGGPGAAHAGHDLGDAAARNLWRISRTSSARPAPSRTTGPSSSSATGTRWATGASAC